MISSSPSISLYSPHLKKSDHEPSFGVDSVFGELVDIFCYGQTHSVPPSSRIKFRLPRKCEMFMCGLGVGGNWFTSELWRRFRLVGMYASREVLLKAYIGTGPLGQMTSTFSHSSEPRWPGRVSEGNLQLFPGLFRKIFY